MAVQPGILNFRVQRRADHVLQLQFKDKDDVAINLTNWVVTAQAWNQPRTTKYADFVVTVVNAATGIVTIALSDTDTAALPLSTPGTLGSVYYDVLLIDPNGIKEYYLEGQIFVSEGYTA